MPGQIDENTGRILVDSASGSGDVTGPASSTDNAIARFDGATGKIIKNSGVIIDDSNNVSGMGTLGVGAITSTGLLSVSLAGNPAQFTNTTDQASNQVLVLQGDRATPANSDEIYQSFLMSDSAGNQDEIARITARITNVTSGAENSRIIFSVKESGVFAEELGLTRTSLYPITSDGLSLGGSANMFSDLFRARS